jgi:hypothetical protein
VKETKKEKTQKDSEEVGKQRRDKDKTTRKPEKQAQLQVKTKKRGPVRVSESETYGKVLRARLVRRRDSVFSP